MADNVTDRFLRENEENQNREWTRNPFKTSRYIAPLVTVFVISLGALLAAILIYVLHVQQQEKRVEELEQRVFAYQEETNLNWKALKEEISEVKDKIADVKENRLHKLEQHLKEYQEKNDLKWKKISEYLQDIQKQQRTSSGTTIDGFISDSLETDLQNPQANVNFANYFQPKLFTIGLSVMFSVCM